ncbi:MAG: 2-phosphosulfolactate phosphatase [candidate division WOR-3 bacterium]|nr:MAG: 2-phosphosulfolactate phosphatase [candidate division WOR-3 bacterium]
MKRLRNKPAVPIVKLDWNIEGVGYALKNRDIVVIVDTLRFSSAVVTAVANGFAIYPVADQEAGKDLARAVGAYQAGKPGKAKYTISPHSYLHAGNDEVRKVVLFSPNGATCAASVKGEDIVYIGCMLNARAVGLHVSALARTIDRNVTLIAAGEQRAIDSGERVVYDKRAANNVFAIEDYLACGAIISNMALQKNAEARFCELAYRPAKREIKDLMLGGFSGMYLVQHNMREDVDFAARLNVYDVIPVVRNGRIEALSD